MHESPYLSLYTTWHERRAYKRGWQAAQDNPRALYWHMNPYVRVSTYFHRHVPKGKSMPQRRTKRLRVSISYGLVSRSYSKEALAWSRGFRDGRDMKLYRKYTFQEKKS